MELAIEVTIAAFGPIDLATACRIGRHVSFAAIALLASRDIDNAIAAGLVRATVGATAIARHRVAIVADLTTGRIYDTIATGLDRAAVGAAAIARYRVAVIAKFRDVPNAIAAALVRAAVGAAAIARHRVAIVAHLRFIQDAVAANIQRHLRAYAPIAALDILAAIAVQAITISTWLAYAGYASARQYDDEGSANCCPSLNTIPNPH